MANGVTEIWPNQPFNVRAVNTSMKTHRLPKGMVLGHALPHPTSMVALIADTDVVEIQWTATTPPSLHDFTVGDQEQVREKLPPM
jgi:Reverse transcriptase (RNA-dependent DNA polymerase)